MNVNLKHYLNGVVNYPKVIPRLSQGFLLAIEGCQDVTSLTYFSSFLEDKTLAKSPVDIPGPHPSSYFIPISSSRIHYLNVIMRRLKRVFGSRSETPNPASSRAVWPRRRPASEGDPLKPQPEDASNELPPDEPTTEAGPSAANKPPASAAVAPVDNTETGSNAQHAQDTGELPRSKNGTKRLKRIVARLRGSLSQEDDPISDTQPQTAQEGTRKERPSSKPLSSNPVEPDTAGELSTAAGKFVRFDDPKEGRKVSGQTTHSQESSQTEDTVCRDPARHIAMPIQEPLEDWGWPGLMLRYPDSSSNPNTHTLEGSDPFSDGKATDVRQAKSGPSRHSAGTSREESSRASEGTLEPIAETDFDTIEQVIESAEPEHPDSQRASSANSQTSRVSWRSTLDSPKAISAFNRMASQFGIPISIPADDTPSPRTFFFVCAWIATD